MSADLPATLDSLRREVDRLDEAMVDLLVERMRVVQEIARVKQAEADGRPAIRPAREAQIIRRLAGRADGRFPALALSRMWRELLAATTRAQRPFAVAACVPAEAPGLWDVARDHFGSLTPLRRVDSPQQALRLLTAGEAQLACLPLPGEQDSWWTYLLHGPGKEIRAVIRLPFCRDGAQAEAASALVMGTLPPEPSGDDATLVALEATAELSRGRLLDLMAPSGRAPRSLSTQRNAERGTAFHLIEIDGFLAEPGIDLPGALGLREHVLRAVAIGGYARALVGPA